MSNEFKIRTTKEDLNVWNKQRIIDDLVRETYVDIDTAVEISNEVETQIAALKIPIITSTLIRELVNSRLIEKGLLEAYKYNARLGIPFYDVESLLKNPLQEGLNLPPSPEASNLILAEAVKKQYASLGVFSEYVIKAHNEGDIHIENLGLVDRPLYTYQMPDYIIREGLNIPSFFTVAKPAKHPEVLISHIVRFSAILQTIFSSTIGWLGLNYFFAPFLVGAGKKDIDQLAQMLLFDFSQQGMTKGGKPVYSEIELSFSPPHYLAKREAIGPEGKKTGKSYSEFEEEAAALLHSLIDCYTKGDGAGRPFFFPKPRILLNLAVSNVNKKKKEFLNVLSRGIAESGSFNVSFVRENEAGKGYRLFQKDQSGGSIHINLPRIALKSKGSDKKLFSNLLDILNLTCQAHIQKKVHLEKLMSEGEKGAFSLVNFKDKRQLFLEMDKVAYSTSLTGLNEMVEIHKNVSLTTEEGVDFAKKVLFYISNTLKKFKSKYMLNIRLEQLPSEIASYKFARHDLQKFSPESARFVKGEIATGGIYYTESSMISYKEAVEPSKKMKTEGEFHSYFEKGGATSLWLGEESSSEKILNTIIFSYNETSCHELAFIPHFTICYKCSTTVRGIYKSCKNCSSDEVGMVTNFGGNFCCFSMPEAEKKGELSDRFFSDEFLR